MRHFLLCSAAMLAAVPAHAQDQAAAGVTGYAPGFFARAQPANAYDMVALVPGFRLIEGDADVRGYSGSAGNVLIDGQRPAGKGETLEEILKRIAAGRVQRIELIRSGAAGYDMQGYAVLVNIVLRTGGTLSGRVEAEDAFFRHGYTAPRLAGQLTYDSGARVLDASAAAYREIDDEHGFGRRDRFDGNGAPVRLVDYAQPEGTDYVEGTIAYRQPLLGGTIRLNGLAKDERMFANIAYDIAYPVAERIDGSERNHTRTYEGGLRYERPLGASSELEAIASYRSVALDGLDGEFRSDGEDRSIERSRASERIVRAAFRHGAGRIAIEAGAEGAVNVLDSANQLFEDGVAVPLPNAVVRVEEKRAEFFSNAVLTMKPALALEAGLRYEISQLEQTGDTSLTKSLSFLKPRARLSWSPSGHGQLRLLVEREAGQLDFADFVGVASLTSGTVTAGNRDLEPESLWRVEAAFEHRFGAGSIVVAARREWISDVVDQLPIYAGATVYDSVGNIGSARRDEIEVNLNLPLDGLGLKGLTIKADGEFRRSEVTDPTTGARRAISGNEPVEAEVAVTYDLPAHDLRFGANYVVAEEETSFKVAEIERDRIEDRIDLFVEYKPGRDWTIRLFGKNLTDSPAVRTRDIYAGPRGSSAFRYREIRTLRSGPYAGLSIQRSFGG